MENTEKSSENKKNKGPRKARCCFGVATDQALLTEVLDLNPFAGEEDKTWENVAINLHAVTGDLKITAFNCKRRVIAMLKNFRSQQTKSLKR